MDFEVLIIGTDTNAYYLARCYHEEYNRKANILGKNPMTFTKLSNIVNITYDEGIWDEDKFIIAVNKFASKFPNKKILAISSNETYAKFLSRNRDKLNEQIVYSYPNIEIIESLIMKDKFYETYKDSKLDLPLTYIYNCEKPEKLKDNYDYPLIVKPANVIEYNHIDFSGKRKIYRVNSFAELEGTIQTIINGGYKSNLIIQEFIEGDDSHLFDVVVYCDSNKKVKLISLAQIGLQEHSKNMIGNAAVLINGYNQFNNTEKVINKIKKFMENIGYQGFAEFDIKYDKKDKKFKVMEINARQGRCSYYIVPAGYNIVKCLADDLIYNRNIEYSFIEDKVLLSFVSKRVVKNFIKNENFKNEVLRLWKERVNPLKFKKDTNFKRKIWLWRKSKQYYLEYKNSDWEQ